MIVVTGLGVVAPTGVGSEPFWASTLAGKNGIGRLQRFNPAGYSTPLAGEVPDYSMAEWVPPRLLAQTDRMTHFALTAAAMALDDAGVAPGSLPEYSMAVVTANSCGGADFGQRELQKLWRHGPGHVGAYMSIAWFYAASTGQVSIRHGMRGPCGVIASEQAGALDAVGHARRKLRGGARLAIAGGTDAPMAPAYLVAQLSNGLLSSAAEPAGAYLPFDARANGYVPGEGGAMLIIERGEDAARRRAPRRYGEIAGYSAAFDPPPGSGRPPALRRAITQALADAQVTPGAVDLVLADGYGVPALDRQEAEALAAVFGPAGVPVTVPKSATGRLYAGGAAVDLVIALLSIRDQVAPATIHVTGPAAHAPVDLVCGEPREMPVRCVLVVARGLGGFNAAVVLRAAR